MEARSVVQHQFFWPLAVLLGVPVFLVLLLRAESLEDAWVHRQIDEARDRFHQQMSAGQMDELQKTTLRTVRDAERVRADLVRFQKELGAVNGFWPTRHQTNGSEVFERGGAGCAKGAAVEEFLWRVRWWKPPELLEYRVDLFPGRFKNLHVH